MGKKYGQISKKMLFCRKVNISAVVAVGMSSAMD